VKLQAYIDGIAFWATGLPDWAVAAQALRHAAAPGPQPQAQPNARIDDSAATPAPMPQRPAATLLAPNERRRAPDSVLVALQVAQAAVAQSGHDPRTLASVFTSAHGDLPIIDALCSTLATTPLLLSPTRFHHSVHNAASGYWAIAAQSPATSTALSAFEHSFAAGLLEALVQVATEGQPVLLVGCDTEACGPLRSVNRSRGLLGVALVLAPTRSACSQWGLSAHLQDCATVSPWSAAHPALQAVAQNALADALPLAEALAREQGFELLLALGAGAGLHLIGQPHRPPEA
jgi:Beta-ketoacyl synthase, N-terminal domain